MLAEEVAIPGKREQEEIKRSKSLTRFGIILIGPLMLLFVFGFNKTEGAEWKLFQATSVGDIYYYDPTNIKRFPNDTVWVWVKIVGTTGFSKGELKELKDPQKGTEVIKEARRRLTSQWKQLFEINCSARMVRVLSATLYDSKGIIKEDYEIPSDWVPIAPDSVTNYLTKILCP